MSEVILELSFIAKAIWVVQYSLARSWAIFFLTLISHLTFSISYEKFSIVVDISKHLVYKLLILARFA